MLTTILLAAAIATPGGWTAKTSGGVTSMTPDGLAAGEIAVIEVHPPEAAPDLRKWADAAWAAFTRSYSGLQGTQVSQGKGRGGLTTVTYGASMVDAESHELYAAFYAVGQSGRVEPVLFVAGSFSAFQKYGGTAATMVNAISSIGPAEATSTFVAQLHSFRDAGAEVAATSRPAPTSKPASAAATPTAAPPAAAAPEGSDADYYVAKSYGIFVADHKVIAEGVTVSLAGEWREDLKHITLRLREDGTYALNTGAAVAYVNSNTGTFSHAVGGSETETGTWAFAAGTLTLTPAARKAVGVSGYGPSTTYTPTAPDPPHSYSVAGVTIQYTPLQTTLPPRTRPGLHLKGRAPSGGGEDWDVILRSAPVSLK